jgi:hypothetical protein
MRVVDISKSLFLFVVMLRYFFIYLFHMMVIALRGRHHNVNRPKTAYEYQTRMY